MDQGDTGHGKGLRSLTQTATIKLLAVLFPFLRCIEDTELIGLADHRKYKTPRQVREIVTDR
jgi:hypothetical protein